MRRGTYLANVGARGARTAGVRGAGGALGAGARRRRCTTLTFKYSSNLDANRRTPGSIRRGSSLRTGGRARWGFERRGRQAGRQAHRRAATGVWSRGCGASAALHVTVRRARSSRRGHRLTVASPSYCLPVDSAGTAARVAPPRCTPPAPRRPPPHTAGAPPPHSHHPLRPEEFSASGGKNRLCSEPRIISARRTAPLRRRRRRRGRSSRAGRSQRGGQAQRLRHSRRRALLLQLHTMLCD